jgi:hypothetical protein
MTPEQQFKRLVDTMLAQSEATFGGDQSKGAQRMFGSTSIKSGGKMFAFLHRKERLVVKLPEARVSELVAAGRGDRYDPGDGRLQREWFELSSTDADEWVSLATEAERFVGKR